MPHITVRGVQKDKLVRMSTELKKVVYQAAETKEEYVKIFYSAVERVDAATEVAVDVYWMHRPQELCDKVATAITKLMKAQGADYVQVTFTEFEGPHFYENNVHY